MAWKFRVVTLEDYIHRNIITILLFLLAPSSGKEQTLQRHFSSRRQFGFSGFCELHKKKNCLHDRWVTFWKTTFKKGWFFLFFTKLDGSWDFCHQSGNCKTNCWHSLLWFPLPGLRSSFNVNTVFLFEYFFFWGGGLRSPCCSVIGGDERGLTLLAVYQSTFCRATAKRLFFSPHHRVGDETLNNGQKKKPTLKDTYNQ